MGRKIVRRREMQVRHSQTESSRLFRAHLQGTLVGDRAAVWGGTQSALGWSRDNSLRPSAIGA